MRRFFIALYTIIIGIATLHANAEDRPPARVTSGIEKLWKKSFSLEEDQLRRIAAEFDKAGKQIKTPTSTVFRVVRRDDRFYETTQIDDVFSDPNSLGREIAKLQIEMRVTDPEKVKDPWEPANYVVVDFALSGSNKSRLFIRHEDRTWSLTTADAIEAQIERTFHAKQIPSWLIVLLVASIYAWGYRLRRFVRSNSVGALTHDVLYHPYVVGSVIGLMISVVFWISNTETYQSYFGPESGFMWGEARKAFLEREGLRSNVFWVIIVGLPLSVIGNLATYFLTRPSATLETQEGG